MQDTSKRPLPTSCLTHVLCIDDVKGMEVYTHCVGLEQISAALTVHINTW